MSINLNLFSLIRQEADNIKRYATEEEIGRLNFDEFNPDSEYQCIYGQMTGTCYSEEAFELINQCAVPYSKFLSIHEQVHEGFKEPLSRGFTAIEYYTVQKGAKNAELIAYLKGETETLEL